MGVIELELSSYCNAKCPLCIRTMHPDKFELKHITLDDIIKILPLDKIKEQKLDSEIADILWKILEDSASYSFNKSHSCCYAALAACTVYLKFKHPKEFYLSLLKMTNNEPNPIKEISKIHKEMDLFNIKLLPPHLIKSKDDFSIEGNDIRFGLLSIKGISD